MLVKAKVAESVPQDHMPPTSRPLEGARPARPEKKARANGKAKKSYVLALQKQSIPDVRQFNDVWAYKVDYVAETDEDTGKWIATSTELWYKLTEQHVGLSVVHDGRLCATTYKDIAFYPLAYLKEPKDLRKEHEHTKFSWAVKMTIEEKKAGKDFSCDQEPKIHKKLVLKSQKEWREAQKAEKEKLDESDESDAAQEEISEKRQEEESGTVSDSNSGGLAMLTYETGRLCFGGIQLQV